MVQKSSIPVRKKEIYKNNQTPQVINIKLCI